ncbi:MAG TPA: DUF3857 domain-containing protein [Candidatus Aquilonibacter sp.]|nr:DUF3857 domain-containing protein [Candidatus Aquilonibacter sp.]
MSIESCGFRSVLCWFLSVLVVSTSVFVAPAYARQSAGTSSGKTSPPGTPASQNTTAGATKPADYSEEPYVIEKTSTSLVFQSDGTYTTDITVRVRVQSQAAVQEFGVVSLPYASATSTLQLVYARVTTPDGQVIATPPDNVLDMPAEITQQAPFYSDLKVLQAAVKGLAVGDTLEYAFHGATTKPVDPGQFWFDFDFFNAGVALDEELQISVPQGKYVNVKSPDVKPTTEQKDGQTIYSWKTSHLQSAGAANKDSASAPKHSAVQITTFHDWGEVGAWFYALAAPEAVPTPDVRAKALELTNGATTDQQKIQALYNFVSTKYRYIGIDFGIGRYQPHAASDVLSNDYGDCKDKDTLLTALLASVGIKAYPALIGTTEELDPDVPSPAQFDHVITAIPQGQGYLFLDTTPEVAPYGYLIAGIRDKKALVIPGSTGATLVQTPADPPFPSFFNFRANGSLTESGEYDGKMQVTIRGDAELIFRLALRQVGESQWNTALQAISSNLGFGGTVSDGAISNLETADKPLELNYSYKRDREGDWDDKQITAPLPPVDLAGAPDESAKNPEALKIGSPFNEDFQAAIKLPSDANPQVPAAVSLHESFADYDATYSVSAGVLHIERKLAMKAREVPVAQFDGYREFVKSVLNDESRFIPIFDTSESSAASSNPDAVAVFNKGLTARQEGDVNGAIADFQQAVTKDPNYAQAWGMLGVTHMQSGDRNLAVTEMKKAAALAPSSPAAKFLARSLLAMRLPDDSLEVWRMIEKSSPQDADAPIGIGSILMSKKQYADALPELQKAAKLNPTDGNILVDVAQAYIKTGDNDQGKATIQQAVKLSYTDVVLNNAAWALVEANLDLDDALRYSTGSVKQIETQTAKVSLTDVTLKDFQAMTFLSADWDTLGWIQFKLGHNDEALSYLNAAWNLTQDPVGAYHLGQVYEKLGKTHEAVIFYEHAVSSTGGNEDAQHRLDQLRPNGKFEAGEHPDFMALQTARTVELKPFYHGSANAQFNVLIGPGPKVLDAKFLSGSEALQETGVEALKEAKFDAVFPTGSSAVILRQGVLDCESVVAKCTFVMLPPNSVHNTN